MDKHGEKRGEESSERARLGLGWIDRRFLIKGCQRRSEAEPATVQRELSGEWAARDADARRECVMGGLGQPLLNFEALSEERENKRSTTL